MIKIYKLQCPDGQVLSLNRAELLEYMTANGLKERTVYNSRITQLYGKRLFAIIYK